MGVGTSNEKSAATAFFGIPCHVQNCARQRFLVVALSRGQMASGHTLRKVLKAAPF